MITSRTPAPPPLAPPSITRSTCRPSGPTPSTGDGRPPTTRPPAPNLPPPRLVRLGGALRRLRTRGEHGILDHFHSPLRDLLGVDLDAADLPPAVGRGRDNPATRRAGHRLLGQL